MVWLGVLIVQLLTLSGAGRLRQVPAEPDPQLSVIVPVGVAPAPVQVVTDVTVVEGVPASTSVGVAETVEESAVVPSTVKAAVVEAFIYVIGLGLATPV